MSLKPAAASAAPIMAAATSSHRGNGGPAALQPAAPFQPDSCRLYDTSAIAEIVAASPDLAHLRPQTADEHAAVAHYLRVADNALTPPMTTWLYAAIGLIPYVAADVDPAREALLHALSSLEATLAVQPSLLPARFTVADVAVAITLFPAYKNLLDQATMMGRLPSLTKWFFACINHAVVQYVYDQLQAGQVQYEPKQEARKRKVTVDDYHIIQVLGKGCMGKVLLVRHKKSSNLYALKSISKSSVIVHKELNHTLAERKILSTIAQIHHPFLIQCHNAFTSENELFLVLDFVAGGDMATQLAKFGRFPAPRVQFYAAEIVLGMLELHRLGVVYRDLKPENILLQPDGHILLTDFGLSKMFRTSKSSSSSSGSRRTNTFAGTAEYLAPEILRNEEYGFEVDWWSFGTLIYEMQAGVTPFWADNHATMYQRVLDDPLEFPDDVPPATRDFLGRLLERDPARRLGSGASGPHDIQSHPFFAGVSWEDVYYKRVAAPYVPKVRNPLDLSNFEECFTAMSPRLSPASHDLSASLQDYFAGYSWAPGAPIGSLSRSFVPSTSLASSFYGSSHMSSAGAGAGANGAAASALARSHQKPSNFPPYADPSSSSNRNSAAAGLVAAASRTTGAVNHASDFGGAFDMDLDVGYHHPAGHPEEDELDLDLLAPSSATVSPAPSNGSLSASSAIAQQLTFSSRVKKPPATSSAAGNAMATPAASASPSPALHHRPSMDDFYSNTARTGSFDSPKLWTGGLLGGTASAPASSLSSPTPSRPGTPTPATSAPLVAASASANSVFAMHRSPSPRQQAGVQRSNSGHGATYWQMFTTSRQH
ncbi:hypothetical protein H9P43_008717 [Blastocladiella emersonii ATCC 22665]|nr:hypothetical protein H9P43_008717 [Blastocladiella emersonii ATCC 22665]